MVKADATTKFETLFTLDNETTAQQTLKDAVSNANNKAAIDAFFAANPG